MLTQRRPVRDTDRLVYIGTAEKLLSMRPFSSASFAFDQDTIEESQRRWHLTVTNCVAKFVTLGTKKR